MEQDFAALRNQMVEEQLKPRNIRSDAVLDAMNRVPRHLFVPSVLQGLAYEDAPLPIGLEQTISQPYIVAYMTEQLRAAPGMKVLEIGTGSGYQAAVLAQLGCQVYSVERWKQLADGASQTLAALGYDSVHVRCGSGYRGWPEQAPFDAIIVTAAPVSTPEKLVEQLKEGGRMILPVGEIHTVQMLKRIVKKDGRIIEKDLLPVSFVPMLACEEKP